MGAKTTVREAVLDVLVAVAEKGAYSPIVLNSALASGQWPPQDKRLATALVYGVLQRRMTLDYYLSFFVDKKKKTDAWVKWLLYMAIYQKVFLDRIPDHAIVNEAVTLAKKRGHRGIAGFVNGVLRRMLREGLPDLSAIEPEARRRAVRYSHPQWIMNLWERQWDRQTAVAIADADNLAPNLTVRVNRLKGSREALIRRFSEEGVRALPGELSADGLIIESGQAIHTRAFHDGCFTVQDESSMLVADAVAAEPGMSVLDACAAPGGKTTHLAERMKGAGHIDALDLYPHKIKLIDQAARRLGLENIETHVQDARTAGDLFAAGSFDRVLLDAPCSGLGVMRRKPEIRWSKTEAEIRGLIPVQRALLDQVAPLVKPGGRLIYSTCTIHKEENEDQITAFLARHPEFRPDSSFQERLPAAAAGAASGSILQIMPYMFHSDGFFISCLERMK